MANQPSLSPQAELVEDLTSVVYTFSGRLSGPRRYKRQIQHAVTGS
ncbi:MAG: hypothetical protein OXC13_14465 [Caldilineaceae bacterium]|nr:hypothetical protein [Caldilineaceae bacterium]